MEICYNYRYVRTCVCTYVCICVCVCMYVYICMYMCMDYRVIRYDKRKRDVLKF